jgi:hypothetical protein
MGLFLLGAPPTPYTGLVASRARMLTNSDTTNKQVMGSYGVISTEALTSIKVYSSNFLGGLPDFGIGAAATISCGVKLGSTFWQGLYGGNPNGTIPDVDFLGSDAISVSIPANTPFAIRQFYRNPNGILYFAGQSSYAPFEEATNVAVSGLTDQTMSGTITNAQPTWGLPPLMVTGTTINGSVIVLGDSIAYGVNDVEYGNGGSIADFNGKRGIVTPSLGATPFLNLALASETAQNWTTNATARKKLIPFGSHLITQHVTNDIVTNNRVAAQVIADLQLQWALARSGQKKFHSLPTPRSSDSISGWTTDSVANGGSQNALHLSDFASFSSTIRVGGVGLTGWYEAGSALATAQDSDIWKFSGAGSPFTADGTHPNQNGYALVAASGAIGPIAYP